jgi:hypothetical protein
MRRKIRLIEANAKCRHLKKLKIDLCRDFAAGVYLSEAQKPYPSSRPLHTVYVYTVYVFTQGRGGGVEPERRLEGQQFTNWVENTNMTDCISSLYACSEVPFQINFLDDDILLWCLYS